MSIVDNVDVNYIAINAVGISAIVCSLIYRFPQMYKIYKTRSGLDISSWMIWIQNFSYVLYVVYGIFVHDWIYISSSLLSFIQNIIVLLMRAKFAKDAAQSAKQSANQDAEKNAARQIALSDNIV